RRLGEAGPSEHDLERVRTIFRARWARRLESTEGRASAFAAAEALGGVGLLDAEYERLLSVDADAVGRAAREWLDPAAIAAVAYLPEGLGEGLDAARLRDAFTGGRRQPPVAVEVAAPAPPRPVPVRGAATSGVFHAALPGADILVGRKPGVPLVSLGVYRRRTVPEPRTSAGLGALAMRSAVRGAGDLDATALALSFERLGGGLTPMIAADWSGFGTSVLSEHAGRAATLLERVLVRPRFDSGEVSLERTTLAEEALHAADDMVRFPIQLALGAAFGDRGYGVPSHGLPETVPTLTEAMVRAWHACELATGRTTVVAVGDVEPERLAGQLAGIFGGGTARPTATAPAEAAWQGGVGGTAPSVVPRAKRQTAMAMFFPGPSRHDPRRYTAEVWAAIAGGLGGRLFGALRDRRSLAYTVMASSWQRAGAGGLLLYLATSPEREEEAEAALLDELALFRDLEPAADEVARAVSYLAGQAQVRRQTGTAVAAEIAEAWLMGDGLDELAEPALGFRRVTAVMIRELAAECLDPARRVLGIVRGGAAPAG
ncbi:MAG TPA: insulinase family protein, partial [Gemmatimonadales bacterium]